MTYDKTYFPYPQIQLKSYPTYKEAYAKIKEDLLKKGYITEEQYKKNIWKG